MLAGRGDSGSFGRDWEENLIKSGFYVHVNLCIISRVNAGDEAEKKTAQSKC
jgi:hypothetical protein